VTKLVVLGAFALSLVSIAVPNAPARSTQCQPVRAVFYTSNDWLRLAQGLGANPSGCAQYYISIPPPTANKTEMRSNAASQVDALGPNFHALAEVNYTAWANWVTSTGNSWYAAGQQARANMDAAGFNVAGGDTWAVNEFPSSVLANTGGARQDAEQLVQGLYAGDGSDPPAQGVVFMIGVGQGGIAFSQYQASLESWFQDSIFWTTMSSDVSDFLFESYGDVRDYAVAGEDPTTRIGYLNAFLQAPLDLVSAANAPSTAAAAKAFLSAAYGPLANASWAWSSDYGWTQVTSAVMADYISAETYAMRAYGAGARIGFAWNPSNTQGLSADDFNTQVGGILDRLAGSIHETDDGDPAQACEATGCSAVISGAAPVNGWSTFSSWAPTAAAFTSAPQTTPPGTASGPLTVELQTGGVPTMLPIASTVTLSSSSPTGRFAIGPGGPWTPTLALTIQPGTDTASFYTLDSSAGSPTLTTNLNGQLATQTETIPAPVTTTTAPPPPPPPPPPAAQVTSLAFTPEGDRMHLALRVVDDAGRPLPAQVRLALLVGSSTVADTSAATTADGSLGVTAEPRLERGCYSVRVESVTAPGYAWDEASPTQTYCVTSLPSHVSSVTFTRLHHLLHVELHVVDDSGRPLQARVLLAVFRGSAIFAATTGLTGADGQLGLTPRQKPEPGCYSVHVESVDAPGYTWDKISPTTTYCVH
jgi:hypothetical protein